MKFFLRLVGYCIIVFPYSVQLLLGRWIGRIAYIFIRSRRKVAFKNIERCFPDFSPSQQKDLCWKNFQSMGMGITEVIACWLMSDERIEKIPYEWIGKENYEAALKTGKGIIALSGHFTCIEMAGQIFGKLIPSYSVYKALRNEAIDQIIVEGRGRYAKGQVKHTSMKAVILTLKEKKLIWFAPDQDFGRVKAEFVPFCGVPAATISATAVLAKLGDAVVMPMFFNRTSKGYQLFTLPVWDNFPSGDPYRDAKRYNDLLSNFVREHPENYIWVHRRFKTVQAGQNFYEN